MVDPFQFDAYASPAETTSIQKLNQNDEIGPLEQESKPTLFAMEPGRGSKIDINTLDEPHLSIPRKSLSRSSSSSSSKSSSRDFFQLGGSATVKSSNGTTDTPELGEENFTLITEPGHGSKIDTDHLMAYPTINLGEPDLSLPSKTLGPSSSSSSSSSSSASESSPQDTFELGANAITNFSSGAFSIFKLDKDNEIGALEPDISTNKKLEPLLPPSSSDEHLETSASASASASATNKSSSGNTGPPLASDYSKKGIPISSMHKNKQSSHGLAGAPSPMVVFGHSNELNLKEKSATQIPPVQVMDRSGDSASAPYRIPSYVFARTKSTAPMEWSLNSNESLFSIHTGNMSFTREQLYWMSKSGELDKPAGEVAISAAPALIDLSSNQLPPTNKSTDVDQKMDTFNEGFEVNEGKAAATMREVIKENEEDRSKESSSIAEGPSNSASISNGSTKSFAFPILTGDGSLKLGSGKQKKQSKSKQLSRPQSQPQTPKESPNEARTTSKAAPYLAHGKWLSCFSCCPFCSLGH